MGKLHKNYNYFVFEIGAITMDHVQGFDRSQEILFPAKIDDYIEEENLVRFIEAFVALLDMTLLGFVHAETKTTGRPPYNPADLLKLYIYGYLNSIRSSRKLETETHRNLEVMWLLKKLTPDHKTIADFRKNNADSIKKVFKQFVFFCKELNLYGREVVAIDGSKFKAVNSKKRNFNEDKLIKKLKDIEEKIEAYLKELEENDKEESSISQPDAKEVKEKIKQLEERKSEYQELLKKLEETGEKQVSLTDPDSRMMMNNQKFDVCYNVQTTIDDKNKLIVDYEVTNDVNDKKQLNEMASEAKQVLEVESLDVLADKGFYNPDEIKKCVDNNTIPYIPEPKPKQPKEESIPKAGFCDCDFKYDPSRDVYTCPESHELTFSVMSEKNNKIMKEYRSDSCSSCECKSKCTRNKNGRVIFRWEHEVILDEMRERVKKNKDVVKKRNCMSEHPFGTIKRGFNQGYLLLKGLRKVRGEMGFTMLAYNMRRVINILGVSKLMENMNVGETKA
jgi:transposase